MEEILNIPVLKFRGLANYLAHIQDKQKAVKESQEELILAYKEGYRAATEEAVAGAIRAKSEITAADLEARKKAALWDKRPLLKGESC